MIPSGGLPVGVAGSQGLYELIPGTKAGGRSAGQDYGLGRHAQTIHRPCMLLKSNFTAFRADIHVSGRQDDLPPERHRRLLKVHRSSYGVAIAMLFSRHFHRQRVDNAIVPLEPNCNALCQIILTWPLLWVKAMHGSI